MRANPCLATLLGGVLFVAAGCGGALTGIYVDEAGETTYAFRSDGRASISMLGAMGEAEYRLDGNRVLVTSPQGTVVLTRSEDRLYGPMSLELVRQR